MRLTPFSTYHVEFTSPAAGALLVGGGTISIMWQDSCIAPLILDLSQYQLFLVAGVVAMIIIQGSFANGNQATANIYFFKMVINYFSRFSLTGMMGSFPENSVTRLASMGLTKYAAMQTHPLIKITKKTKTPLYPTSPYTLATTFLESRPYKLAPARPSRILALRD
ncbi:hypothetical protein V2W45_1520406 [Cenococcum geophilum]